MGEGGRTDERGREIIIEVWGRRIAGDGVGFGGLGRGCWVK